MGRGGFLGAGHAGMGGKESDVCVCLCMCVLVCMDMYLCVWCLCVCMDEISCCVFPLDLTSLLVTTSVLYHTVKMSTERQ